MYFYDTLLGEFYFINVYDWLVLAIEILYFNIINLDLFLKSLGSSLNCFTDQLFGFRKAHLGLSFFSYKMGLSMIGGPYGGF